jgi:hypothetical protein
MNGQLSPAGDQRARESIRDLVRRLPVYRIVENNVKYPCIIANMQGLTFIDIYKTADKMYYVTLERTSNGVRSVEETMNGFQLEQFFGYRAEYTVVEYKPALHHRFVLFSIFDYDRIAPRTSYERI